LAEGHDVTVLDDFSRGKRDRLADLLGNLHVCAGDIRDRQLVSRAMQGCEVIFHLAYVQGTQTFYAEPKQVIQIAGRGILNILDACEEQGGKELFLVSSSEAYQVPPKGMVPTDETVPLSVPDVLNPRYSYGGGKIFCEIATLAYARSGILDRAVVIRPHNVLGPDGGYEHVVPELIGRIAALKGPDLPIQGTGLETRSFCYIDDAIDGLLVLLDRGVTENVYHLGATEEVTIVELAHRIARCCGRVVKVVPGTLPKGSPPRRLPQIAKLRKLGYEPRFSLDEALALTVPWYLEHPKP
jgi:dTDP-glucose 4,6-dehydratase/UDP-glucose 4-epimerase